MDQLPRLGKRELICLLLFTCNYVVSVWRGFLFLWVLGMGYVILLWHSLSLPLIIFHIILGPCILKLMPDDFPPAFYLTKGDSLHKDHIGLPKIATTLRIS